MTNADRPRGGHPRGRRFEAEVEALTDEHTPRGSCQAQAQAQALAVVDPRELPFVPAFPTPRRTYSAVGRFLEQREAVLGRGSRRWLAGRLLRAVDGDLKAAVEVVVAEGNRP